MILSIFNSFLNFVSLKLISLYSCGFYNIISSFVFVIQTLSYLHLTSDHTIYTDVIFRTANKHQGVGLQNNTTKTS